MHVSIIRWHLAWTTRRSSQDRGASLVEYAFLVALIAIACLVAVVYLGEETSTKYSNLGNSVATAGD